MEQYYRNYIKRIHERQRRYDEEDAKDRHMTYIVAALVLLPLLAAWIFQ